MKSHPFPLPPDLPRPVNDGAADHLVGTHLPDIALCSTTGRIINLSKLSGPQTVIFCYPKTGVPGQALPEGWDAIPGARGCTPQACNFRDRHQEFLDFNAPVFGLSTQTTEYQQEMAARLQLPFEVLSDSDFALSAALRLPALEVAGMRLLKRLTLIVRRGLIAHVFYPVFPPDESADQALRWLSEFPVRA